MVEIYRQLIEIFIILNVCQASALMMMAVRVGKFAIFHILVCKKHYRTIFAEQALIDTGKLRRERSRFGVHVS